MTVTKKISDYPELMADSFNVETDKGKISLIPPCEITFDTFEICGDGFEDVERYETLELAMYRIYELLN